MRTHNFYYYGRIISKGIFELGVPEDWDKEADEYTFGGFKAIKL